jgi:hypothetical protein
MLNMLKSNVGRKAWNNMLCRRCRHKNGLNTNMKRRNRSILSANTTILNIMTFILAIIA